MSAVPGTCHDTVTEGARHHHGVRIIAGTHRGHRIAAPKGRDTRPTSDRVRENAFNLIGPVDGADVLDLYAGSGALGLEALSRGAATCVFVESNRDACRTINANLDKLRLEATVLCQDVLRAVAQERRTYDLVLCDPPYDSPDETALDRHFPKLLTREGLLVYESSSRADPPEFAGLEVRTSRKYGAARLTLFTRTT
jgi:16S rRNA (guanine966-N2)-methyltransferase